MGSFFEVGRRTFHREQEGQVLSKFLSKTRGVPSGLVKQIYTMVQALRQQACRYCQRPTLVFGLVFDICD